MKIKWQNRLLRSNGSTCLVSVDGTDFRIVQPAPFDKKWYSHKFKGPGLRYEVGISIQTSWIVWISGPYPCGSWPDISIFNRVLRNKLLPGEQVEADKGYAGNYPVSLPDNYGTIFEWVTKQQVRSRHEIVNGYFKNFKCLHHTFIHHYLKHKIVFQAVVVLVQLGLVRNPPFQKIKYKYK